MMSLINICFVDSILSNDYVGILNNETVSLTSIKLNHRLACQVTLLQVGSRNHFLVLQCTDVFHIIKRNEIIINYFKMLDAFYLNTDNNIEYYSDDSETLDEFMLSTILRERVLIRLIRAATNIVTNIP